MFFVSYLVSTYVVLPILWTSGLYLNNKYYYDVCPIIKCFPTILECLQRPNCKSWLEDDIGPCSDPTSIQRRTSAEKFRHVQHPDDAAYCQYQSFDAIQDNKALEFVECIGQSGCIKPATQSDMCADMTILKENNKILSLLPQEDDDNEGSSTGPNPHVLDGTWYKLYTTGWDMWECQWTDFWSPQREEEEEEDEDYHRHSHLYRPRPEPDNWMTEWPTNPNVWRMDLYWQNRVDQDQHHHLQKQNQNQDQPVRFHMNNEMYLGETWDYSAGSDSDGDDTTTTSSTATTNHPYAPFVDATLKTRAVMWGTEAHENWYLLDYNPDWEMIMVYYCAHTAAVDRFDSMVMVLKKTTTTNTNKAEIEQQDNIHPDDNDDDRRPCKSSGYHYGPTKEQHEYYQQLAYELLGKEHGNLQRIEPSCDC